MNTPPSKRLKFKKRKPLDQKAIQKIVDEMPGGLDAFCHQWGWLNFARALEKAHKIK